LAQTYTNWECIVVDDGSTDNTDELLATYCVKDSRFQYHHRPTNRPKGANACRNYGLRLSKGKFLIFFDSDDVMKDSCFYNRVSAIEGANYDMVVFSMGRFEDISKLKIDNKRIVINKNVEDTILDFLKGKLPWNICRPIFKSEIIKSNKISFNEKLLRFQDVEFNIQVLVKIKPSYISIDETDCYYRFNDKIGEKYFTKGFSNQLFFSLGEYYHSIFKMFDKNYILKNRKIFINQFYSLTKNYFRNYNSFEDINFIIRIFKKYLKLTISEIIIFYSISSINKYYLNKKGYFKITQYLKSILIEANEK